MAAYQNVMILMVASLLLTSVISDSPVGSPLVSPVAQPPSVFDVPTPSPVEPPAAPSPVEPMKPPAPAPVVEPPVAPASTPVQPLAPSPVESPPMPTPVNPPSISRPPAEAPAPESNGGLKRVSVGFVCFGAFLVSFMA